jgi:hypothetical protein
MWISNDEGLHHWWKSSRLPMGKFIQQNRDEIDQIINNMLSGKKQAHYLVYG